ncbi:MAG: hypothetical protein JW876_07015 [Candidatus Krumholzibacteriota bacterium]|nr:hypothetical protein [Candidatus Krumholzibacteriota bacterium]
MRRLAIFALSVFSVLAATVPVRAGGVVYCVGDNGTILALAANGWHAVPTGPGTDIPSGDYSGIWGSGEDDIYITRNAADIITWDGAAWGTMTLDVIGTRYFYDVHGTSANDILLLAHARGLCLAGTLVHCLHYGSYWDPMSG